MYDLYTLLGRGLCMFLVFYVLPMFFQWIALVQIVEKYSELETHETLKRVVSANAILKHYQNSSLITIKHHAKVLSFLKANLV